MSDEVIEDDRPIVTRKAVREYNSPHDAAVRAANWAMKDDPQCVMAHQRVWRPSGTSSLHPARSAKSPRCFEAANADWRRITTEVLIASWPRRVFRNDAAIHTPS